MEPSMYFRSAWDIQGWVAGDSCTKINQQTVQTTPRAPARPGRECVGGGGVKLGEKEHYHG